MSNRRSAVINIPDVHAVRDWLYVHYCRHYTWLHTRILI